MKCIKYNGDIENLSLRKSEILNQINEIYCDHVLEHNTTQVRENICSEVNEYLVSAGVFPRMVDRSFVKEIDEQKTIMKVFFMGIEMDIEEYLDNIFGE